MKYNVIKDNSLNGKTISQMCSDNPKEATELRVSNDTIALMDSVTTIDKVYDKKLDTLNKGIFGLANTLKLGNFISELHEIVKEATGLDASDSKDARNVNTILQSISPDFKALCTGNNKKELNDRRRHAKKLAITIPENFETINGVTFIDFNAMVGTNDISKFSPSSLVQKISSNKTAKDKKTADAEPEAPVIASDLVNDMFALAKKHKITQHAICEEMEKYMIKYQSELHAKAMLDLQAKNKDLIEQQQRVNNKLAVSNAKKLNAETKKLKAPEIEATNARLEAEAKDKKNRNLAMFGISA